MVSGAEYEILKKLRNDNKQRDPEQQLSTSQLNQQAREAAREFRDYQGSQTKQDQTPLSARDLTQMGSRDLKGFDRQTGGGGRPFWSKLFK